MRLVPSCSPSGILESHANAINDQGHVTGIVACTSGLPFFVPYFASVSATTMLPGNQSNYDAGYGINASNVVVGSNSAYPGPGIHAFRWSPSSGHTDIHPENDTSFNSVARGINGNGLIVGRKYNDTYNAAFVYTAGLKGRFDEGKKADDHQLTDATYPVTRIEDGRIVTREEPALPALNERLRDDYIADCQRGVDRWNQIISKNGIEARLRLPHRGFHRAIGTFAATRMTPDGAIVSPAEWDAHRAEWLPSAADQAFIESLMVPVVERGRFAGWIAPPTRGINGHPVDFEYVRS